MHRHTQQSLIADGYRDNGDGTMTKVVGPPIVTPVARESDLHEEIMEFCRARGWVAIHSRMDRRTTIQTGMPDFQIWAEFPKVYLVECKSKTGKLSQAQQNRKAHFEKLGWPYYVVRSLEELKAALKVAEVI